MPAPDRIARRSSRIRRLALAAIVICTTACDRQQPTQTSSPRTSRLADEIAGFGHLSADACSIPIIVCNEHGEQTDAYVAQVEYRPGVVLDDCEDGAKRTAVLGVGELPRPEVPMMIRAIPTFFGCSEGSVEGCGRSRWVFLDPEKLPASLELKIEKPISVQIGMPPRAGEGTRVVIEDELRAIVANLEPDEFDTVHAGLFSGRYTARAVSSDYMELNSRLLIVDSEPVFFRFK